MHYAKSYISKVRCKGSVLCCGLNKKHNMNQLDLKTALQLIPLSRPPLIQTSKQQQLSPTTPTTVLRQKQP